jgi:hypothetical protein
LDETERGKVRRALLDYCGQDTLAMVKLLERLRFAYPHVERTCKWQHH